MGTIIPLYYYRNRVPRELTLGADYLLKNLWGKVTLVRLIQPTPKGFNFLNMETNKCLLKRHLYKSKKEAHVKSGKPIFMLTLPLSRNIKEVDINNSNAV